MDDLVQWLHAQLDEDERTAREACKYAEAEWRLDEDGETVLWWPPEPHIAEKEREKGLTIVSDRWRGQTIESGGARLAPHIVRHDPARVLREIDAKRQLLYQFEQRGNSMRATVKPPTGGAWDDMLRLHALPYADQPGYRDEWRP